MDNREIKVAKVKVAALYEIAPDMAERMDIGTDLVVNLRGSIVQVRKGDNQDGTVSMTYLFKAMTNDINFNSQVSGSKEVPGTAA